jgi:hypothetical protein
VKNRDKEIVTRCQLCSAEFEYGHAPNAGRFIDAYQISVCATCYRGNSEGWARHHEEKLLTHLMAKGLRAPRRNSRNRLPRDG